MREKNGNDIRHTLSFHSLRKFFTTQMCEVFAVPAQTVELLCGHDIGVSQSYMMPSPDQMRKRYASTMQKIILTQAPMEADIEIAVEEKIQDFKSSTDIQDMIRAEVAKAFDRLHTIEEQISKQQEKAEEIGQGILNELYERELEKWHKDTHDEREGEPEPFDFGRHDELPTSIEDFKAVYWNSELEKDETSYFFDKPIWEKLKKHPRWREVVREYIMLEELQKKREALRKGSTES